MAGPLNLQLLERTREAVNADRAFARLGTTDVRMGIKAGDAAYLLDFEAFGCSAVTQIDVEALRDADFYLDLSPAEWKRYLSGRAAGSAPSLVSLDVDTPDGIVKGGDPLQALKFERYHLTLQAFLDAAAHLAGAATTPRHAVV
jgi:hypothetical protein